jgi:hypothetical protein
VGQELRHGGPAAFEVCQEHVRDGGPHDDRIGLVGTEQALQAQLADLTCELRLPKLPGTRTEAQIEVRVEVVGCRTV